MPSQLKINAELNKTAAVVLAAGKGSRLNCNAKNKVMSKLANKPMVGYTVGLLKKIGIKNIIVVVGFDKKSVMDYFGRKVVYAIQEKQLGTAHAVLSALPKIPGKCKYIMVVQGDDSAFYPPYVLKQLFRTHIKSAGALTLLTVFLENPNAFGRIIRDKDNKLVGIVEEKNADPEQKLIKEINTACYCFNRDFLEKYLKLIEKNEITGEYYLTDIIGLGIQNGEKITALPIKDQSNFVSVNTNEELDIAKKLMAKKILETF